MRTPFIAANWKLNKTIGETAAFIDAFLPLVQKTEGVDAVIAPVFTSLAVAKEKLKGSKVILAAQDVYFEESGAFTGEVGPALLKDAGCTHVIIGHSERREYFGDTDEIVNKKTKAALAAGLKVIFCIGESLQQREGGQTESHLASQLEKGLKDVPLDDLVIAYEPIWAIGTGKTATPAQAQETHAFIRSKLASLYGAGKADAVRILYGGSVKPDNVKELMANADVDGALVGGASLKPDSFAALVNFAK